MTLNQSGLHLTHWIADCAVLHYEAFLPTIDHGNFSAACALSPIDRRSLCPESLARGTFGWLVCSWNRFTEKTERFGLTVGHCLDGGNTCSVDFGGQKCNLRTHSAYTRGYTGISACFKAYAKSEIIREVILFTGHFGQDPCGILSHGEINCLSLNELTGIYPSDGYKYDPTSMSMSLACSFLPIRVYMVGATSGLTSGTLVDVAMELIVRTGSVRADEGGTPFSKPGDSGSRVYAIVDVLKDCFWENQSLPANEAGAMLTLALGLHKGSCGDTSTLIFLPWFIGVINQVLGGDPIYFCDHAESDGESSHSHAESAHSYHESRDGEDEAYKSEDNLDETRSQAPMWTGYVDTEDVPVPFDRKTDSAAIKGLFVGPGTVQLESLTNASRKHYNSPRNKTSNVYNTTPPGNGEYVAVKFSEDGVYYRGRVHSVDHAQKTAEIVFIHCGNAEQHPFSYLRPLVHQFSVPSTLKSHIEPLEYATYIMNKRNHDTALCPEELEMTVDTETDTEIFGNAKKSVPVAAAVFDIDERDIEDNKPRKEAGAARIEKTEEPAKEVNAPVQEETKDAPGEQKGVEKPEVVESKPAVETSKIDENETWQTLDVVDDSEPAAKTEVAPITVGEPEPTKSDQLATDAEGPTTNDIKPQESLLKRSTAEELCPEQPEGVVVFFTTEPAIRHSTEVEEQHEREADSKVPKVEAQTEFEVEAKSAKELNWPVCVDHDDAKLEDVAAAETVAVAMAKASIIVDENFAGANTAADSRVVRIL